MIEGLTSGLARGIAEGKNPRRIASELLKSLNGQVEKIGKARARMIARTEVIRAHHVATIQEYKSFGVTGLEVMVEWSTAGFNVCPDCASMEGRIFKPEELEGMIPMHPNCRCVAIPANVGESESERRKAA